MQSEFHRAGAWKEAASHGGDSLTHLVLRGKHMKKQSFDCWTQSVTNWEVVLKQVVKYSRCQFTKSIEMRSSATAHYVPSAPPPISTKVY